MKPVLTKQTPYAMIANRFVAKKQFLFMSKIIPSTEPGEQYGTRQSTNHCTNRQASCDHALSGILASNLNVINVNDGLEVLKCADVYEGVSDIKCGKCSIDTDQKYKDG